MILYTSTSEYYYLLFNSSVLSIEYYYYYRVFCVSFTLAAKQRIIRASRFVRRQTKHSRQSPMLAFSKSFKALGKSCHYEASAEKF